MACALCSGKSLRSKYYLDRNNFFTFFCLCWHKTIFNFKDFWRRAFSRSQIWTLDGWVQIANPAAVLYRLPDWIKYQVQSFRKIFEWFEIRLFVLEQTFVRLSPIDEWLQRSTRPDFQIKNEWIPEMIIIINIFLFLQKWLMTNK